MLESVVDCQHLCNDTSKGNCKIIAYHKYDYEQEMLIRNIEEIIKHSEGGRLNSYSPEFFTALCRYEPYARLDYSCAHIDPASERLFNKIYLNDDRTNIEKDIEDAVRCFPLREQMKSLLEENPGSRKMIAILVKTGPERIGSYLQRIAHIVCNEWVEYGQRGISHEIDVSFYFMREKDGYWGH